MNIQILVIWTDLLKFHESILGLCQTCDMNTAQQWGAIGFQLFIIFLWKEKSPEFLSDYWHNIFWSLGHLVWCMCFQFRFLWLRKWLPNWFAGTRFIKVIALCWSQEKCQSRKVSFTVVFLFVALLQISICPLSSTPLQFCLSSINMICLWCNCKACQSHRQIQILSLANLKLDFVGQIDPTHCSNSHPLTEKRSAPVKSTEAIFQKDKYHHHHHHHHHHSYSSPSVSSSSSSSLGQSRPTAGKA